MLLSELRGWFTFERLCHIVASCVEVVISQRGFTFEGGSWGRPGAAAPWAPRPRSVGGGGASPSSCHPFPCRASPLQARSQHRCALLFRSISHVECLGEQTGEVWSNSGIHVHIRLFVVFGLWRVGFAVTESSARPRKPYMEMTDACGGGPHQGFHCSLLPSGSLVFRIEDVWMRCNQFIEWSKFGLYKGFPRMYYTWGGRVAASFSKHVCSGRKFEKDLCFGGFSCFFPKCYRSVRPIQKETQKTMRCIVDNRSINRFVGLSR